MIEGNGNLAKPSVSPRRRVLDAAQTPDKRASRAISRRRQSARLSRGRVARHVQPSHQYPLPYHDDLWRLAREALVLRNSDHGDT